MMHPFKVRWKSSGSFLPLALNTMSCVLFVLIFKLCESQNSLVVLKLSVRISVTAVREESAAIKVVSSANWKTLEVQFWGSFLTKMLKSRWLRPEPCGNPLETSNQVVTNNPHLGVIFTDDLSFSTHVRQVCAKASRKLGFLRRNLRNCPQTLRELAYTSMCRSVLEYASPIWDPYLQPDIDSLERIWCKAARFTTRDFCQRSSVTAMMRDLQWEPLAERRTKARVIMMYLILNDEVAIPVSPLILQPVRRGRFIQPAHHHQQYKHSFYPWTICDWNLLPSKLKDSSSLDSFKNGLPVRYY